MDPHRDALQGLCQKFAVNKKIEMIRSWKNPLDDCFWITLTQRIINHVKQQ